MIVDQLTLGLGDRAFDSLKLLREIEAGTSLIKHGQDRSQMTVGPLQAFDDFGVSGMLHGVRSAAILSGGIGQVNAFYLERGLKIAAGELLLRLWLSHKARKNVFGLRSNELVVAH